MTSRNVDDLIAWAKSRVEHCRREEQKFGSGNVAIEAATERRTLQAVLRLLGQGVQGDDDGEPVCECGHVRDEHDGPCTVEECRCVQFSRDSPREAR